MRHYNTEKNIAYVKFCVPKDRLEQYNAEIRADERRKFVEWLTKSKYRITEPNGFKRYVFDPTTFSIDFVIAEYEKEQENEHQ